MIKNIVIGLIVLVILAANVLRFAKLDTIPDGFHVDEMSSAVTIQCFAEKGCDAEMRPWPLFGVLEYGTDKPPTYDYPAMLWAKVFGSTVPSLRALTVFVLVLGIVGLFFLARLFFGSAMALTVALAATCSPWAWVVTRVALEAYFAPVFVIWGLYFFWRSDRWWDWALAGALFALGFFTYPPARMQIPMLMASLVCFEWGRRFLRWPSVLSLLSVFVITILPIVPQYMNGELSQRFKFISIFNKDFLHSIGASGTPGDMASIFAHNFLLHLSPDFLFMTGDPSYVHSTRHLGLLSWFDCAALLIFLVFLSLVFLRRSWKENPVIKHHRWLIFLAVNFFIGIIPSALTYQELPHALRICGSWPFMMLFTGTMWWAAAEMLWALWPVLALAGTLSCGVLIYQYFWIYPQESKGMFDFWVKDVAEQLQTQEDWQKFMLTFHRRNYHIRYFLVHRLGLTCRQANDLWWKLHDQLDKQGMF